ncbi:MAG: sugar phosphate nucleotidyltransferase [Myxococcota bacterium]|nr:sugar phosphate nucleotidyltransferase [Myxococcota bacterium]
MKGVILAGGKGTRLMPLTKATNKHLLPVGLEPMIFHPIRQLAGAGITDILVVTSTDHMGDVVRCLGSGAEFGVELTYRVQEQAGGIAEALLLAEGFAAGGRICVVLGDNVFQYSIKPYVDNFRKQDTGARVLLKRVEDPRAYGVAALDEKHVLEIQEKPEEPPSDYAVVGLYLYDADVFGHIRQIEPSARGEFEITSVNNRYIEKGLLQYDVVHGGWTDAGKPRTYLEANELMFGQENMILNWNIFNKRS